MVTLMFEGTGMTLHIKSCHLEPSWPSGNSLRVTHQSQCDSSLGTRECLSQISQ